MYLRMFPHSVSCLRKKVILPELGSARRRCWKWALTVQAFGDTDVVHRVVTCSPWRKPWTGASHKDVSPGGTACCERRSCSTLSCIWWKVSSRDYFICNKRSQFRVIKHSLGHKYTTAKRKKKKICLNLFPRLCAQSSLLFLFLLILWFIYEWNAVPKWMDLFTSKSVNCKHCYKIMLSWSIKNEEF